ncbi:hypothetical protein EJB05_21696, partial [Eragrostis curvula]
MAIPDERLGKSDFVGINVAHSCFIAIAEAWVKNASDLILSWAAYWIRCHCTSGYSYCTEDDNDENQDEDRFKLIS